MALNMPRLLLIVRAVLPITLCESAFASTLDHIPHNVEARMESARNIGCAGRRAVSESAQERIKVVRKLGWMAIPSTFTKTARLWWWLIPLNFLVLQNPGSTALADSIRFRSSWV